MNTPSSAAQEAASEAMYRGYGKTRNEQEDIIAAALDAFAAEAVLREREACAQIAEEYSSGRKESMTKYTTAEIIAGTIRARSTPDVSQKPPNNCDKAAEPREGGCADCLDKNPECPMCNGTGRTL